MYLEVSEDFLEVNGYRSAGNLSGVDTLIVSFTIGTN